MKTLITYLLILTGILLSGCKNSREQDEANGTFLKGSIEVVLELEVTQNDSIGLYYTTDGSTDFFNAPSLWKKVEGKEGLQKVNFQLPEGVLTPQLRIDLGRNKNQGEIIFKRFTAYYNGKVLDAYGTEVFRYFRPDITTCTIDIKAGTVTPVVKDGVKQSPSLYPHEKVLRHKIAELINQ